VAVIPKISTGKITHVLRLPEFWAVASALIVAPILAPIVDSWLQRIPYIAKYRTAALVGFGILVLIIASSMGAGIFRAIVLGAGASFVILAVIPIVRQYAGR